MNNFLFSSIDVTRQVFYHTAQSFAIVNLKPILPGHVLVSSKRVVPRLADLTPGELADLMHSVKHVGSVIESAYKAEGLTISCQDGPAAGQTVPHVHFHLLPRKLVGDFFEGRNDHIYPALEHSEGCLPKDLLTIEAEERGSAARNEAIKVDAEEDRKPRSLEDMEKEARWLETFFDEA